MANSSSINTPYLILSGICLLAIVVVFTVFRPLVNNIGSQRDKITEQKTVLQERQDFLRTIDRKTAALQMQADNESKLAAILPVGEHMEDALRIFYQGGQQSGISIESIINNSSSVQSQINARRARGDAVTVPTGVIPLAVNLRFSGAYQQLRAFINSLEHTPRLMDIMSLTLSRNEKVTDQVTGEAQVQFYMQSDKSNL